MLHRPLYRGEVVWNRSQKIVRGGTKKQRKRPESEWLTLPAPELRIVSDDLWRYPPMLASLGKAAFATMIDNRN